MRAFLFLLLAAAAVAFGVALAAGDPATAPQAQVRVAEQGDTVLVTRDGVERVALRLGRLRELAEQRWSMLAEVPRLAGAAVTPQDLGWLGPATLTPDGSVVVVTSAYRLATNVSLIVLLAPDGSVTLVDRLKPGWVEEPTFGGGDGELFAYRLDTARTSGEALAVDDLRSGRELVRLSGKELLHAFGLPEPAGGFLPHVRELRFAADGALLFRSDDPRRSGADPDQGYGPSEPSVTWSLRPHSGVLTPLHHDP